MYMYVYMYAYSQWHVFSKLTKKYGKLYYRSIQYWSLNLMCMYMYMYACEAVPGRKWTLFCRVLWLRHSVWSTISLNFHQGWGSNKLCTCSSSRCYHASHMSPALKGSSEMSHFKIHNGIMLVFYLGLPHMQLLDTRWVTYHFVFLFLHVLRVRSWSRWSLSPVSPWPMLGNLGRNHRRWHGLRTSRTGGLEERGRRTFILESWGGAKIEANLPQDYYMVTVTF